MSWTDERIELLRGMWEKGLTASQIAEELGGVSRNAVIGKAHRLGLKSRPSPVKSANKAKATKPAAAPKAAPPAAPATEAAPAAPAAPATRAAAPAASRAAAVQPKADTRPAAPAPAAATTPPVTAEGAAPAEEPAKPEGPRIVSIGPGGFIRQGPGDQQAPIPPAPPRRLVPAKPSPEMADKTSLLDLNDRICRWPMGHPGEPDFHFCGEAVNPGFPYCVEHCGRAYQAQLPRGTRRPPPPAPFGGPRVR
ncbi:MAG TPA: GcrA family cell cycle regulator [Sphingopyxis sp.]|nr:GcrA family cell cycle regulator [Sphingopyxis sp.]